MYAKDNLETLWIIICYDKSIKVPKIKEKNVIFSLKFRKYRFFFGFPMIKMFVSKNNLRKFSPLISIQRFPQIQKITLRKSSDQCKDTKNAPTKFLK